MYRGTGPDRLLRVDHDMPVGAKTDTSLVDLRPANGDDLVLFGIKTGQFKIDRDQGCIDEFIYVQSGTRLNIGRQAGLPALSGKYPAASAQAPLPEHQ